MMRGPAVLMLLGLGAVGLAIFGGDPDATGQAEDATPVFAPETPESCAGCHRGRQPGLLAQWDQSVHMLEGVTCEDCHGDDHEAIFAARGRVPARRCQPCHEEQTAEFLASAHNQASPHALANARLLAQIPAMQRVGCMGCHDMGGGEEGSCGGCHGGHRSSAADARLPEACGTCHMGPDHPHIEAWEASPHGVAYRASGGDERQAPSCVGCHMPRGTHDVSLGLTIGKAGSGAVLEGEDMPIPMHTITREEAREERARMLERCTRCHTPRVAREALEDADDIKREADRLVGYAADIVQSLYDEELLQPMPTERPAHPTLGHEIVLGGPALYEHHSEPERIFFDIAKFAHAITFKGAYHQASDHTHWLGIARLKEGIVELEAEARRLRGSQ